MDSENVFEVATGHWYDYSKTGWSRATYTVTAANGVLILTALSTFIALVASSFWCIVAFVVHQWKTHPRPHDGLHEQHLVILRNTSNPLSAIWYLLCTVSPWAGPGKWWGSKQDPYAHSVGRRTIFMILPPLICWVVFVIAGIFSGRVASRTYYANNVRIKSTDCGFAYASGPSLASQLAFDQYTLNHSANALNYASNCYGSTNVLGCNLYHRQALEYTSTLETGCPFGNRCITETLRLETAWLDSYEDFGINAPPEDRIQLRKSAECAVVNVTDTIQTETLPKSNLFANYYYLGELYIDGEVALNYTAVALTEEPIDYVTYNIRPYVASIGEAPGWQPIPDFTFDNGDVSLFFITFGNLIYLSPVTDPLFSATHSPYELGGDPIYAPDSLAGVIVCVDYFQIQNPEGTIQSTTSGAQVVFNHSLALDFNPAQLATVERFSDLFLTDMYNAVNGLGTSALVAQKSLLGEISIGLPSNQWQLEITSWFETNLAFLQAIVQDYVLKIFDNELPIHPLRNSTNPRLEAVAENLKSQCDQQVIRGITGYQSFSALGIWTIVCTGLFIIFVNLILALFVGSFQLWLSRGHLFHRQQHRRQRWVVDSMFQLQRIAHQFLNRSTWENVDSRIPVTRSFLKPLNSAGQASNDVPLLTPERSANDVIPFGEAI